MSTSMLINPGRCRVLPNHYSWLDHNLIHDHYLRNLSPQASTLYLFLLGVGDRHGMSYYSDKAILQKVNIAELVSAREELIAHDLLAYQQPFYQVLSLPKKWVPEEPKVSEDVASTDFVDALLKDYFGGNL